MSDYGGRIALALKNKGLKQIELATELGITRTAVSKIIHGRQYLDFDLAVKACEVLGITLDYLAYGGEAATPPPFHRLPDRQRIEYLLSQIQEAEYPLVILNLEEIVELRMRRSRKN